MPGHDAPAHARRARISRSRDFDAVYRRGRSTAGRHLVVYLFPRESGDAQRPRLGLSVSRKVGGAVDRNHVKRVLREQFAARGGVVPADTDVVVIARPGAVEYIEERGSAALGDRLQELLERALGDRAVRGDAAASGGAAA